MNMLYLDWQLSPAYNEETAEDQVSQEIKEEFGDKFKLNKITEFDHGFPTIMVEYNCSDEEMLDELDKRDYDRDYMSNHIVET